MDKVSHLLTDMGHQVDEYAYPADLGLGSWMEDLWMVDVVYEIENRIKEVGREPLHEEMEALTHYVRERSGLAERYGSLPSPSGGA